MQNVSNRVTPMQVSLSVSLLFLANYRQALTPNLSNIEQNISWK
jgi:hypothetical protein